MPVPQSRSALSAIPVYLPGKPATSDAHKLSSNENPYPPLPGVIERAAGELGRMNRYPDAGCTRLYAALADRLGLPADHFAAATGSVAVLYALLTALCEGGDEVVYAWRSFEAYPIAVQLTGATSVRVPLAADATHDLDAMAAAIGPATKVVLLCSPNNPTGPVVTAAAFEAFMAKVPPTVLVVLDEAYLEFVREPAVVKGLDALAGHENVVLLRTFSKAYGLAGLRVGYAVAHPPMAEAIRKATAPFSVSDLAQAAAVASLESFDELSVRVDALVAERDRMVAALRDDGWAVPDAQGNFVWLPLGDESVDFAAHCAPVSVRPFAGDGVRVSVGAPAINAEFRERAHAWRALSR